jgi:hypothetical protein
LLQKLIPTQFFLSRDEMRFAASSLIEFRIFPVVREVLLRMNDAIEL